jgi:PPOX class probable F420-dependent enzyme
MAKLSPEHVALIQGKNFGALGTIRPDGSPHVSPTWVHTDGEVVLFNTARGRARELHLSRDNRGTLMIWNAENPYQYVEVSGPVEFDEEGGDADIDFLANKYTGADFAYHNEEVRVIGRLTPERIGGQ